METGRLKFDAHLLDTLGQQYRTSEHALKELVANSWDADATTVRITLPSPLSNESLIVDDNGLGMALDQVRNQFLNIGYDRRQVSGATTPRGRAVRGSRGIGKLAALEIAETMTVETASFNRRFTFILNRHTFEHHSDSLETIDIPIEVENNAGTTGTVITLTNLRTNVAFPNANRLRRVLLREFGVRRDFTVAIDGVPLTAEALEGTRESVDISTPSGMSVTGFLIITNHPRAIPDPGITIRISGRAIGSPTFFGLEDDVDIPKSIRERLVGEVFADHLREAALPNWDGFNTSDTAYQEFDETCRTWLKDRAIRLRDEQLGAAPEQFVEQYHEQIEQLPKSRRELARTQLIRVFHRFFDEPLDKKHAIAEHVLDVFEQDEYWLLVQRLQETSATDLAELASILEEWGFYEINGVVTRARQRITFVDQFEALIRDPETLELSGVHRALKDNLWLLDDTYELLKSNRTLTKLIKDLFDKQYTGSRSRDRPDLFMAGLNDRFVLVELKRPRYELGRADIAQAEGYRDIIQPRLPSGRIDVVVIGGSIDQNLLRDRHLQVRLTTFWEVTLAARQRCEWLVSTLEPSDEFDE